MVFRHGSHTKEVWLVRICVDFRALNESVLSKVQPLPTVDETLAHLNGEYLATTMGSGRSPWQKILSISRHLSHPMTKQYAS